MRRGSVILAVVAAAAMALAPSLADARAGGRSSFGSRGARTFSAPPVTNTAPSTAAPMQRSMTSRPAQATAAPGAAAAPGRSGFGSGLAGGLLGGLIGAGLGGLLMGHGFFGGGLGGFGFLGLLLQLALLFFAGRWLFRTFARRQPAVAGVPSQFARTARPGATAAAPMAGNGRAIPHVTIGQSDFQAFERLLLDVQAAWSAHDLRALSQLATPEMVSYFNEQLTEQASSGVRNSVTDVKLEQGDLAEAWAEAGREYASVAMRFSMLDVTRDGGGRVVDGDTALRAMATELWTFVRSSGGRWMLSAIQQT